MATTRPHVVFESPGAWKAWPYALGVALGLLVAFAYVFGIHQ